MKTDLLKASWAQFQRYKSWLRKEPLSEHSKRAYQSRVNHFLVFLATENGEYGDVLTDKRCRDVAIKDYKVHMKRVLKAKPTSVNSALTAIDHFYEFMGMERSKVKREDLPQLAPRALEPAEQRRFLGAAERCRRTKDQAVALLLFYSGIRIGECAALNVEDVPVNKRSGKVIVRSGKGDKYREVPLNQRAREAVLLWLAERRQKLGDSSEAALFVNPQARRMSATSLDRIVRKIGRDVGLELSAHVLRHTCLTNLVRNGTDLVLVADIGGHRRLETTRRYTLPTSQDREAAMENLCIE